MNNKNAFNWRTGEPSIFYSAAAEKSARRTAARGMALDRLGRPVVEMTPRSKNAISISKSSDTDRNRKISRGTNK